MIPHISERESIIKTAQAMQRDRLVVGTAGNVSVRTEAGFLITPSAVSYEVLKIEDIVSLDTQGNPQGNNRKPSTEWRFHRDIYHHRPDISAIVHAHPPFATTLACLRMAIPAFHYMVAIGGGENIRCAAYELFGSQALSDQVLLALEDRKGCLLANHGLIAGGETLSKAFDLAMEMEHLSQVYWQTLAITQPALLTSAEMDDVLEAFEHYKKP